MPPTQKPVTRKKNGTILDRAQEKISFEEDEPFSIGIFGPSATGKTSIWSSWPKPILACICSGELKKPGELRSISKKDRENIHPLVIENCEELNEVCEAVTDGNSFYKTVVLDHLTSFSDLCLKQVLGVEEIPPQLSWGFATQQDWGKHGLLVKEFLRRLINLPLHTVVVSQHRWFDPPPGIEGAGSVAGPAVTPTIAGWLVPALDYCIQTFVRDEEVEKKLKIGNEVQTIREKTGKREYGVYLPYATERMTKFRAPRGTEIPEYIIDPNYSKINKIIKGFE